MKRSLILVALLGGGFAFSWRACAENHARRGDTEAARVAEGGNHASVAGPASGEDRVPERGISGSRQGRVSISNAATEPIVGLSRGPTGNEPRFGEVEVETRPPGLNLKAVVAIAPGVEPKALVPSQEIASFGAVFEGWAPEFKRLVGVTHDGRISAAAGVDVATAERPRVVLDFDTGRLVSGVVFDSLSAHLLSDVRATLRSVEGFGLSNTDESASAEPPALEDLCHSDANGALEFRLPTDVAVELALAKRGYATQLIRIEPTASTRTDFGQVALEPVDRLEVRLTGFDPSRYQSYRIGFANDSKEHEIDAGGVAFIECSKAIVDARVVVRVPGGGF